MFRMGILNWNISQSAAFEKIMMFGTSQVVLHQNGISITWEFLPEPARPLSINPECSGWTFQIEKKFNQLHLKNNDDWYVASRTTSKRKLEHESSFRNLLGRSLSTRNVPDGYSKLEHFSISCIWKNDDVWYVASCTTSKRNFDNMRVPSGTC